jgi:hypothetical protein
MTDPHNCGACGHDCEAGECVDGVCQAYTLAFLPTGDKPNQLAVPGDGHVYFANYDSHTVNVVDDGKALQFTGTILTHTSMPPATLLVEPSGDVYFGLNADSNLVPIYQTTTTAIGKPAKPLAGTWAYAEYLASDGISLYFTAWAPPSGCLVARAAGGTSVPILEIPACGGVAVDDASVYVTDPVYGSVVQADKNAPALVAGSKGTTSLLDLGSDVPMAIAVDEAHVYWADQAGIYKKPKIWSMPRETIVSFTPTPDAGPVKYQVPSSLAVVADRIFYTVFGDGPLGYVASVVSTPSATPEIIASGENGAVNIVATPTAVYWVAQFDYRIRKRVR